MVKDVKGVVYDASPIGVFQTDNSHQFSSEYTIFLDTHEGEPDYTFEAGSSLASSLDGILLAIPNENESKTLIRNLTTKDETQIDGNWSFMKQ